MGGIGSGTWCRWDTRATLEQAKRIDVRFMKKQGFLRPGYYGSLSWNRGDEPSGNIRFSASQDYLTLYFSFRKNGGEWERVEQTILFDRTSCNYGGERIWFICPRCQRRVGILAGHEKYFLCRHCYDLPYASQSEARHDRLIRKKNKIGKRIFDETGYRKKKAMHWKTFERLANQYWQLEEEADQAFMAAHAHLFSSRITRLEYLL